MNTLARPPLRLLEPRRPRTAPQTAAGLTLLERFDAWIERLPPPQARHGMGSWRAMR